MVHFPKIIANSSAAILPLTNTCRRIRKHPGVSPVLRKRTEVALGVPSTKARPKPRLRRPNITGGWLRPVMGGCLPYERVPSVQHQPR